MNIYTKYCVYLTIYSGNKLPPFYIGSSSISKISSGYNGSVCSSKYKDIWVSERKQNPHLFKTKIISRHETRQDAYYKEEKIQKQLNVVESPLYINCSFAISRVDNTGKSLSVEHRNNLSKALKGRAKSEVTKLRMKKPKTAEHNKKVSLAKKTMTPVTCPHCLLEGNKAVMHRFHFDNCKMNQYYDKSSELTCPHCNLVGRVNMKRYHFDNCKHKKGT